MSLLLVLWFQRVRVHNARTELVGGRWLEEQLRAYISNLKQEAESKLELV